MQLEEENQPVLSFISQAHNAVCAARAKKDRMIRELAQIETHSRSVEGDVAFLRAQLDSL